MAITCEGRAYSFIPTMQGPLHFQTICRRTFLKWQNTIAISQPHKDNKYRPMSSQSYKQKFLHSKVEAWIDQARAGAVAWVAEPTGGRLRSGPCVKEYVCKAQVVAFALISRAGYWGTLSTFQRCKLNHLGGVRNTRYILLLWRMLVILSGDRPV
jgi:hypothetical protein